MSGNAKSWLSFFEEKFIENNMKLDKLESEYNKLLDYNSFLEAQGANRKAPMETAMFTELDVDAALNNIYKTCNLVCHQCLDDMPDFSTKQFSTELQKVSNFNGTLSFDFLEYILSSCTNVVKYSNATSCWYFCPEPVDHKPMVLFTAEKIDEALMHILADNQMTGKDPWYSRVFSTEDFQSSLEAVLSSKGVGVQLDWAWVDYALANCPDVVSLSFTNSPNLWIFK